MNNKKITFKKLIRIFIIILILCLIVLINFWKTKKTNSVAKFVNDMEQLEEKVSYINEEYLLWEKYNPNEAGNFSAYLQSKNFINASGASNIYVEEFKKIIENLQNDSVSNWNPNLDQILSNYCYFTPSDLAQYFEIENSNYYVIVNFYTGNIISKDGIEYNGKNFYRHYDLENNLGIQIYDNDVIPKIEVVENNGLNKKIKIFFDNVKKQSNISEIYYFIGENDEDKKRCTELPDYQYVSEERCAYFSVNTSGNYRFIVEDTNFVQYPQISINVVLCNKPLLEAGMQGIYFDKNNNEISIESISDVNWYDYSSENFRPAYAKKEDGSYWIWVPRFTYREVQNDLKIDFVYSFSKTSTTSKSTINYELPKVFEESVSGIWMQEKDLNYYNIQSIDFFKKVLTNEKK